MFGLEDRLRDWACGTFARKWEVQILHEHINRLLLERELLLDHFGLTIKQGPELVVEKKES